jgi:hypothetical protein
MDFKNTTAYPQAFGLMISDGDRRHHARDDEKSRLEWPHVR